MLWASTTFIIAVSTVASASSGVFLTFQSRTLTRRRRCSTAADVSRKMATTWPSAIAVANAITRSSDCMINTSQMQTSDNMVCFNYASMFQLSSSPPQSASSPPELFLLQTWLLHRVQRVYKQCNASQRERNRERQRKKETERDRDRER